MDASVMIAAGMAVLFGLMLFARRADTTGPQARKLVADGALLLDVRTKEEFQGGHVDGAMNVAVQELGGRLAELGKDKARPVVVYCLSGVRSGAAVRQLKSAGFTAVHNLGGMRNW